MFSVFVDDSVVPSVLACPVGPRSATAQEDVTFHSTGIHCVTRCWEGGSCWNTFFPIVCHLYGETRLLKTPLKGVMGSDDSLSFVGVTDPG